VPRANACGNLQIMKHALELSLKKSVYRTRASILLVILKPTDNFINIQLFTII
jgi:hypothetical protein